MSEAVRQFILAAIVFYGQMTGVPYYRGVLEAHFGTVNAPRIVDAGGMTVLQRQPPLERGDLNGDGVTDDLDVGVYHAVTGTPVGWTVGGKARKHLYRRCFYIAEKPATLAEIQNDTCLRCLNQWAKEQLIIEN